MELDLTPWLVVGAVLFAAIAGWVLRGATSGDG